MYVLPMVSLPSAVPLGAFTANTGMQAIIDEMNTTWRNASGGVIFGQGVFGDRYRAFTEMVTARDKEVVAIVEKSVRTVLNPNVIVPIESQKDLENVPQCMYMPILTYAPVRKLFDQGMLDGWGVKWEDLPQEDVVGRMIENGSFHSDNEEWMKDPESGVSYVVKTGDPDYTIQQLMDIQTTREFIDTWLEDQMSPDGDHLDLTDLTRTMGKLRDTGEDDK